MARNGGFVVRMIEDRVRLGLVPQVLFEFLHVVTDSRRFENQKDFEVFDFLEVVTLQ